MDTEFVVSEKLGGKVTCQRRLSIAGSLIFFQEYGKGGGGLNDPVWNVGPGGMSHMVHGALENRENQRCSVGIVRADRDHRVRR
ncbi:hypothetical protein JTE90_026910, partial [Oedothorax gibbosus]